MQIVIENLSFSYNAKSKIKNDTLKNLSLTINEGEFFGIIGQTGSGKSTLIKHLNALIPVQSGKILMGEFDLSKQNKKLKQQLKSLRSKVGLVFQYPEYQLFAETVYEDVAFGLKNFYPNLTAQQQVNAVYNAITQVGLDYNEVKDKSPFELSGGQKRRVAIAGVLVTNPEVLILDEPVAGLDPMGKKQLMQLLHNLMVGNRTIIIVSHDMDEVCENCSKVAVLKDGQVVKQGVPEQVFLDDDLDDLRLGVPITAYLKKQLEQNNIVVNSSLKTDDFIDKLIKKVRQ